MKYLIVFAIIAVSLGSCGFNGFQRVSGNGILGNVERTVSDFSNLNISGPIEAILEQGDAPAVRIEGDENLLRYVQVSNDGDKLRIRIRPNVMVKPRVGLKVYVTGNNYDGITITGSGNVRSQEQISSDKINLNVTGSGDVALDLDAPIVHTQITGSGSARLKGRTQNFDSRINGSGELYAFDLLSENTSVRIAGSGDAEVFASKQLSIRIAGSGDVAYKGTGSVSQSVAGSGNIHKAD